jgi:hypothetical protein
LEISNGYEREDLQDRAKALVEMVQAEIDHLNKVMKLSLQQTAPQHAFEPKSTQKR